MKKVLIAIDYFTSAQQVAEIGSAVAKGMYADIVLLHIMANPGYYASSIYDPIMGYGGYMHLDFFAPNIVELLKKESYEYLLKTKKHLNVDNIEMIVAEGNIADTILETALSIKADLTVMGTHSKNWFEHILIGSEAEKVLHRSKVPMLIVPTRKIE
jgi:nucleotide-binding universal stress UspA family protein